MIVNQKSEFTLQLTELEYEDIYVAVKRARDPHDCSAAEVARSRRSQDMLKQLLIPPSFVRKNED
jgi:hypothetical protein